MIPSILWQTWKTHEIPESLRKQAESWELSNPQLERKFFNDKECSEFIFDHFGEDVHRLYMRLPQPIMRADFWRVAVVYEFGGYYSDLDITCNVGLDRLIPGEPEAVFVKEFNNISNFFFGAKPKHPVLRAALDQMIEEAKRIIDKETQSFGMHALHQSVKDYYKVKGANYRNSKKVYYLKNEQLKAERKFIHSGASLTNTLDKNYVSWRKSEVLMNKEREDAEEIVFFTTFNKNGYELYGKSWVETFSALANYYNKFRAKIYYEGFIPTEEHPCLEWIQYEKCIPQHAAWKEKYKALTRHPEYVKTMTIRFSHKAFVIQHFLTNNDNDYIIWLDGDCLFKQSDYSQFPSKLLGDNLLACQVEHAANLNHIESGILIFNGKHAEKQRFIDRFEDFYRVENIVGMDQPYDGFILYKTLTATKVPYLDLNEKYGKGGIQSDPNMTFKHPDIEAKFVHNIGWTGKNQYENWEQVFMRDDIYQKMQSILFGRNEVLLSKKKNAHGVLEKLRALRNSEDQA